MSEEKLSETTVDGLTVSAYAGDVDDNALHIVKASGGAVLIEERDAIGPMIRVQVYSGPVKDVTDRSEENVEKSTMLMLRLDGESTHDMLMAVLGVVLSSESVQLVAELVATIMQSENLEGKLTELQSSVYNATSDLMRKGHLRRE